ncbi:MAG TPA: crossover junction endodeoxyribonuclease RuvC [Polyangia bacterium]|jgi:crossover junction endodeoxyribonuclease RuvC|nr:crossover junction endodeoxyribonuclease RuvC [Polyangia bacterium]
MRILGIDPGTRYFGYGVIERLGPGRVRYIECGVLQPRRGDELAARLADIAGSLREVIDELAPTVVAVEGVFHGVNARSALQLGHSRGVALAAAGAAALTVHEYAPATVKRAVAGNGAATKGQVSTMVRALCGLGRSPALDASDALAVAICHAFRGAAVGAIAARVARR